MIVKTERAPSTRLRPVVNDWLELSSLDPWRSTPNHEVPQSQTKRVRELCGAIGAPRELQHQFCADASDRFIARKSGRLIICRRELVGEDEGILNSHRRALPDPRSRGVGGVSKEDEPPAAPAG
jgi:hypothetical protein